ncbi:hypothetical protein CI102_5127 [Trichoderma harzianum]|uniref:UDENN domain-containing protein n=1 Tax=Trichoderma harzianum CBS 226.95 TaxID=983964 RepID=A0A2T4ANZ5_TRIHA|nr:hypothetical protein M431DRAFT_286050 [Trichoderma harzianum CBS 226.95]PKK49840.1 hypothetical protein CI102_5127 [Trichoderma harzianum]PTB58791.1 hypothetical protein M431DRAFT_286050 [Trichoderma harzianum CBS 226.95]
MAAALPYASRSNGASSSQVSLPHHRRTSLSSFPPSRSPSQMSFHSRPSRSPHPPMAETDRTSDPSSKSKASSIGPSSQHSSLSAVRRTNEDSQPQRKLRAQYPRGSDANHVEYILVASFDIDRGPVMEHQYPVAITGDENMLAELMLPDQAHARNQDWTMFFLHKDSSPEDEDEERKEKARRKARRQRRRDKAAGLVPEDGAEGEDDDEGDDDDLDEDWDDDESSDDEPDDELEGPPLIYVLNLVNTKHDKSVKRGAIVKAMAICTRHPFLHIYKPLLLLALEEYFKSPVPETLSMLYESVNAMDLSLMPRLSLLERNLLLASDNKDLFVEKFERIIQMRMAEDRAETATEGSGERSQSPQFTGGISRAGTKAHVEGGGQSTYSVARDTHEFESKVMYKGIPIPIKVPTAVMPETVGDFSLIKLIQNFSEAHAKSPQPFPLHPHLTTNGVNTHPIIVLMNGLLTQKRIIFLGHNMPSGDVAEAVLAACALVSGGILRGFTRHAFPYTDLTKVDDLLNVPGFIAGVTNPTFELHPEWWDVLCDLPSGRVKISSKIEMAPVTEGLIYFQQQHPTLSNTASGVSNNAQDLTGDAAFMSDILRSIAARHGERVIRAKWRGWVNKFTRIAAQFEESVYNASALYIGGQDQDLALPGASGHGYVWADDTAKFKELAGNVTRIEGWRNTRSYYSYIQDLARIYTFRPLKGLDLAHMHDRLRMQRLTPAQSKDIYLTLSKHIHSYEEICLLLDVAPESHAGLFYIALGLFHKDREVRLRTADLLERISEHEAGQHWWKSLSQFEKLAYKRIRRETEAEMRTKGEKDGLVLSPVMEKLMS